LTPGANSIIGTVGGAETQDFVALTIATGFQMTNYVNAAYAGADAQGFTGRPVSARRPDRGHGDEG